MTKSELIQYRSICAEIQEINIKLKDSTVYGTVSGSDKEFPYVKRTISVGGVTSTKDNIRLFTRLDKLKKQKENIENFVDSIEDSLTRRIFEYRYMSGKKIMSWQRIAFKIGGYDEQYPRRIHNKFFKNLKNDENDEF